MQEQVYPSGTSIVQQGELVSTCYLIANGKVNLYTSNKCSVGSLIKQKARGDTLCDDSLECDLVMSPYHITADTSGPVHCLLIKGSLYRELKILVEKQALIVQATLCASPSWNQGLLSKFSDGMCNFSPEDFVHLGVLGEGAYGKVSLVRCRNPSFSDKALAIKRIRKSDITNNRQMDHVRTEKLVLNSLDNPFIVRCYSVYCDDMFINHIMDACLGGDLWTVIKDSDCLDEDAARFYTACIIEALDYLHSKHIVYRDLKPENLLLDDRGYIKLTDFGFAKPLDTANCERTYSFCGTPSYMAPEVVLHKGHDLGADYWSLGILVFEMLCGKPPLSNKASHLIYKTISEGFGDDGIIFPSSISEEAEHFISNLCRYSPSERLGYSGSGWLDVRSHVWFEEFDWMELRCQQMTPSYIPDVRSDADMSNFDLFDMSSGSSETNPPNCEFDSLDWKDF